MQLNIYVEGVMYEIPDYKGPIPRVGEEIAFSDEDHGSVKSVAYDFVGDTYKSLKFVTIYVR